MLYYYWDYASSHQYCISWGRQPKLCLLLLSAIHHVPIVIAVSVNNHFDLIKSLISCIDDDTNLTIDIVCWFGFVSLLAFFERSHCIVWYGRRRRTRASPKMVLVTKIIFWWCFWLVTMTKVSILRHYSIIIQQLLMVPLDSLWWGLFFCIIIFEIVWKWIWKYLDNSSNYLMGFALKFLIFGWFLLGMDEYLWHRWIPRVLRFLSTSFNPNWWKLICNKTLSMHLPGSVVKFSIFGWTALWFNNFLWHCWILFALRFLWVPVSSVLVKIEIFILLCSFL